MKTTVYFVGSGPGDPDLLTIRATKILESADVVIYDGLVTEDIISMIPKNAMRIPIRGNPHGNGLTMKEIGETMIRYASEGKNVVRLKSGAPLVFGRLWEEAQYLEATNISYEIVPGITSALSSAAFSKTPLTDRRFSSSFAVVTGHEAEDNSFHRVKWKKLADAVDTLIILMGASTMRTYTNELLEAGINPSAATCIVFNASRGNQRIIYTTLEEASRGIPSDFGDLCVVIINLRTEQDMRGKLVSLKELLNV